MLPPELGLKGTWPTTLVTELRAILIPSSTTSRAGFPSNGWQLSPFSIISIPLKVTCKCGCCHSRGGGLVHDACLCSLARGHCWFQIPICSVGHPVIPGQEVISCSFSKWLGTGSCSANHSGMRGSGVRWASHSPLPPMTPPHLPPVLWVGPANHSSPMSSGRNVTQTGHPVMSTSPQVGVGDSTTVSLL